jgi:gliding motility-associated-like protein
LGKYFAEFELCEKLHIDTLQITRNDDVTLIDQPIVQFPNAVVTENITSPTITYTNYTVNTKSQSSCHSAHFILPKDTFCINEVLNLYSDTCVKQGNSYWKIRYATDSQEIWDYKFENIAFLHKGIAYISHTHKLAGCEKTQIDNIFIQDSSGIATLNLGKDTFFCGGTFSKKLDAYNTNFRGYLWSSGSHDSAIVASAAGTYWVRATSACGTQSDTIHIRDSIAPRLTLFDQDTLRLCRAMLPYALHTAILNNANYQYLWSTGETTPYITVNSYGAYSVTVSLGCFTWKDTLVLRDNDTIALPSYPDSFKLCNTSLVLKPTQGLFLDVYINNIWQNKSQWIVNNLGTLIYRWRDSCNRTWGKTMVVWGGAIPLLFSKQSFVYCDPNFQKNPSVSNTNPNFTITQWQQNQWNTQPTYRMVYGINIFKTTDICGNYRIDTVVGQNNRQSLTFFNVDTLVLCPRQLPYRLSIVDTFKNYAWQFWGESHEYKATVEGMHYVYATDSCYTYLDSVYLKIQAPVAVALDLPDTLSWCVDSLWHSISTAANYPLYIWNGQASQKGNYQYKNTTQRITLQIPRSCDTLSDSTTILWLHPDTTSPKIAFDTTLCEKRQGVQVTIVNPNDFKNYQWGNGSKDATIWINQRDSLRLQTKNQCFEKTWAYRGRYCQTFPFGLPTAFSPNGDGLNDNFTLDGNVSDLIIEEMSIYNRWGERVYYTENSIPRWDGTYKGVIQEDGIYIYYIRYRSIFNPYSAYEIKGAVHLIR